MKNIDLLNLVNAGILGITANDLDASQAYKVLKFKRAVKRAFSDVAESERGLLSEVGIADPGAFDKERQDCTDPERKAELDKTFDRFNELRKNLYEEEVKLDCKTLPFDAFHALQRENKAQKAAPLNAFEDVLEGVLWESPETD